MLMRTVEGKVTKMAEYEAKAKKVGLSHDRNPTPP